MNTDIPDISVPRNNYDIIFKAMAEQFQDQILTFYGIHLPPIVRAAPNELPTVNVQEHRMDCVFVLADGSYLHLEFQTQFRREELDRFKLYDTLLYESKKRHIHTFVIYGADVKQAEEVLDHGSITYTAHAIYMSCYDGDQILEQLREKFVREESLTKQDQLNMIFLPLMRSKVKRRERAKEAIELANRIPDRNLQSRLMGTIIAIADKFLDDETIKEMLEVMHMSKMYQMIHEKGEQQGIAKGLHEGIAMGKQEGLHEGKQEAQILIAKNLLSLGISLRKIAEGTGLGIDEVKKLRDTH